MGARALLTDFYQLTMAHAYFELGMNETAVFELSVRRLPSERRFLIAAGLEQALEHVESLAFDASDIEYLARLETFPARFLDHLARLRFSGSVHAMPEGTAFFADEPIVRVTAPILEAQLLESRLLNIMHFQSLIASKAARCVIAARGRRLVDFGMRRAHEADAALFAARAAYVAGFDATATVEAGRRFGIPLSGTLAHSFIEAHDRESDAFRHFVAVRPEPTALLIDTYDIERATERVIALIAELREEPQSSRHGVLALRIDSGDLGAAARRVRQQLDAHGCQAVQIVLSGGLDEHRIGALVASGVPVDAFGVGTALDTSSDAPSLDMAYKLQSYAGTPRRKRSPDKATWPGAKQVFRELSPTGRALRDAIVLDGGEQAAGEPLLQEVMRAGRRLGPPATLATARNQCRAALEELPLQVLALQGGPSGYEVSISSGVRALAAAADAVAAAAER